jgi:hypothetical protein
MKIDYAEQVAGLEGKIVEWENELGAREEDKEENGLSPNVKNVQ